MRITRHFFWIGASCSIFLSCSTQKDRFLNRFYHASIAKYNTMYNAKVAFKKAEKERISAYRDNFSVILPVEGIKDVSYTPIKEGLPLYHLVEKKALKAVRYHSMKINGVERNPYMSEVYIMLAKAYYYEGRFKEALEVLDHIILNYPLSRKVYKARVWREKTRAQLGYYSSAIFNYRVLRRLETFMTKKLKSKAYAMLAQAHLTLGEPDKSIPFLKKGAKLIKNKKIKGRYLFILGQIYEEKKQYKDMMTYYNKIVKLKRRTKWDFYIHSFLKKIEYAHLENNEKKVGRWIKKLIRNDYENRDFYNYIYFATARYYENLDSVSLAKDYYQKSIETEVSSPDPQLLARAYESLANLYFSEAAFLKARDNYLGAMAFCNKKTKDYQRVYFKHKRVTTVLELEKVLQDMGLETSSVQEKYEEVNKKTKKKREAKQSAQARFYFGSDQEVLDNGAQEFQKSWGHRALVDNWRHVRIFDGSATNNETINKTTAATTNRREQASDTSVLTKEETEESLKLKRDQTYYRLGLLYYQYLDHPNLAIDRLKRLLNCSANVDYLLPAYYLLFRAYEKLGDTKSAGYYKKMVVENYPNSIYASMVNQPEQDLNVASVNRDYSDAYQNYRYGQYNRATQQCSDFIERNFYHPSLPKFKLLKALSMFKFGKETEAEELFEELVSNYPGTQESEKSKEILTIIKQEETSSEEVLESVSKDKIIISL